MSGDSLAVTLFFWGGMVAAVFAAISMLEKRRRVWIWVLFIFAALFAACGMFWPSISAAAPAFSVAMTDIANNRFCWFLVFAGIVFFPLLDAAYRHGWISRSAVATAAESTPVAPALKELPPLVPLDWNELLRQVYRQDYEKETVELDGKHFVECNFVDVLFSYDGRKPVQMTDCNFKGQTMPTIRTGNAAIGATLSLMKGMRLLRDDMEYKVQVHKAGTR
jgi:hypothetical protein